MAWTIELSDDARRDLRKLDAQHARRVLNFLHERAAGQENPRKMGKPLHGSRRGEYWRYRTGDYRILCRIEDDRLVVLAVTAAHRKDIYR
jgi:mRNA interferase RelE/StbE